MGLNYWRKQKNLQLLFSVTGKVCPISTPGVYNDNKPAHPVNPPNELEVVGTSER